MIKASGSVAGTGTLKVRSGAVLFTGGGPVGVATLDFGSTEGVIHVPSSGIVNSVVTGTNGVTVGGGGTLTLSATNTYSGGTTVNSSTLSVASDTNMGDGPVTLNSGVLYGTASNFNLLHAVVLNGYGGLQASNGLTASAAISGSGVLRTSGGVTLANTSNSYTGGTQVSGTLNVAADGALGDPSGPFTIFNGATFKPTASFSMTRPVLLAGSTSYIDTNGHGRAGSARRLGDVPPPTCVRACRSHLDWAGLGPIAGATGGTTSMT